MEYCRKEIVDKYGLKKVNKIVAGGAERYRFGMEWFEGNKKKGICTIFMMVQGRLIDEDIIERAYECV